MHPYELEFKIAPLEGSNEPMPEPVTISGQLGDEDWNLLNRFNQRAIELFQTGFVQSGMRSTLNIKMEQGSISFSTQLPKPDDLAAFLHRLRPFYLHKEETNFDEICDLIKTRLDNQFLTIMINEQQEFYRGEQLRSMFTISLLTQNQVTQSFDEFIVNSDEFLKKWLYSSEYHFDNDKRKLIESFETIMPLQAQKVIFIQLLAEKIEAIMFLTGIVRGILGIDRELAGRILKENIP